MGAPDLTNWLWPDADLQRQPQGAVSFNPLVLPACARAIVGGISVIDTTNVGLPHLLTKQGIGFTNTSSGAAFSIGANRLLSSNGAGTGDFTIIMVTNAPSSSTICTEYSTNTTADLFLYTNGDAGINVSSGAVTLNNDAQTGLSLAGVLDSNGDLHTVVFTRRGSTLYGYADGVLKGSTTYTDATWTSGATEYLGAYSSGSFPVYGFGVQLFATANASLNDAQARALSANPWQIFQPPKLGIYMPASGSIATAAISANLGAISTAVSAIQSVTSTASSSLSLADSTSVTQSNTASGSSTLGSLATAVTATITAAAIATSSLGGLSSSLTTSETRSASASSSLSLTSSGTGTQSQAAAGSSTLGALSTSITATEIGSGTAIAVSTLGGLFTSAQAAQSITSSASSALGGLSSAITANRSLTGTAVSALGSLSSTGSATQSQNGIASSTLPLLTSSSVTQKQAAYGVSTLSAISSSTIAQPPYTAVVSGTLGGILTTATAVFGAPSYPVNPAFYLKPPYRSFYALAWARPSYAAMLVRTFYVKFNPMLNTLPQFSQKDPREEVVLTYDCTAALNGATITSVGTPAITTQIGQDNPPSLVLTNVIVNSQPITVNGVTIQEGCAVQAQCTAGSFGSQYLIAILVQTNNAEFSPVLKAVLPMAAQ